MAMRGLSLVVVAAALSTGLGVRPQAPDGSGQRPAFRARTDVVQLDVSVLDRQRRPVKGLTASDFTVRDNGVERPIVSFDSVEIPGWPDGSAAWVRERGPDVVSNKRDERRAVVIVLDDYSIWRDPGASQTTKAIATAVIDRLGPADLAAVVYVLARNQGQEFTVDRSLLRAAVARFVPSGLVAQWENPISASTPTTGLTRPSMGGPQRSGACFMESCLLHALSNAAAILSVWPGARKTIVLIGPGAPASHPDEEWNENDERSRMFADMQRANVNVYQFDPHGLQTGRAPLTNFGVFAENTGGRALTNTNTPGDFVPQIFVENSSYYVLGVSTALVEPDGRFHTVQVRVNRPGVDVRARSGYYASGDTTRVKRAQPATPTARALSGGLPAGDLPLSLGVTPLALRAKPGATAVVTIRLDPDADVRPGTVFEFTAVAFDAGWKEAATAIQQFESPAEPVVAGFETALRLDLRPGRYEIRAAVRDTATGRLGSVYTSVVVPDFAREPVTLSGLQLEPQVGGAAMLDDLALFLPGRLTSIRAFRRSVRVSALARVYQRPKTSSPVRVTSQVVDENDRIVWSSEAMVETASKGSLREADYRVELPLDRLTPGEYLLRVNAIGGTASAMREIRFRVK